MRKLLASASMIALASFVSSAQAADMDSAYDWTGVYGGIVGSVGMFTGAEAADYYNNYNISTSEWGGTIGGTLGANIQSGMFVYGVEGDFSWSGLSHKTFEAEYDGGSEVSGEWNSVATLRGRAGLAVDDTLIFVTGGIALVDVDQSYCYYENCDSGSYDGYYDMFNNGWKVGFAAGAGVEHAFTDNLTVKAEYMYIGLPTATVKSEYLKEQGYEGVNFDSSAHLIRVGLNYKF